MALMGWEWEGAPGPGGRWRNKTKRVRVFAQTAPDIRGTNTQQANYAPPRHGGWPSPVPRAPKRYFFGSILHMHLRLPG